MADADHSYWSASNFESIMLCPGKIVLEQGLPNRASGYSAEGTVAHLVLTWALQQSTTADAFLGRTVHLDAGGKPWQGDDVAQAAWTIEVDEDMVRYVQITIDYVCDLVARGGALLVDQRVNYADYLGVDANVAWGTLDVAVLLDDEIIAIDLKYGRGVQVSAGTPDAPNPQLALYALGALAEAKEFATYNKARLVISQPRISSQPSECEISIEALEAWAFSTARSAVNTARNAADPAVAPLNGTWSEVFLRPGDKQCKFCRAKATCPALTGDVQETLGGAAEPGDFVLVDSIPVVAGIAPPTLSAIMAKADLIEEWLKAVRAEVERRLLAGEEVPGWKIVQGKRGNRAWGEADAVEKYLKETARLKVEEMYDLKLKSPTQLEKLAPSYGKDGKPILPKEGAPAPTIGPRQWLKIKGWISQSDGKPHVAPADDPRPALQMTPVLDDLVAAPAAEDFSDLA